MKRIIYFTLFILFPLTLFVFAGCTEITEDDPLSVSGGEITETAPPSYPVTAGQLVFSRSPDTAASLSPAVTEMIFEMGFGDRLVCRSIYCNVPDSALLLPTAGSGANPDIDGIITLSPELLITQSPLANQDLALLKSAGIAVLTLPAPSSVEELYGNYSLLGQIFAGQTEGERLAEECTNELKNAVRSARNSCSELAFIMEVTDGGFLTASPGSFAGNYISRFGRNVTDSGEGYLLTEAQLLSADPQVIFLAYPLSSEDIDPQVTAQLSAFANGYVYVIDSSLMQRPTSRLAGVTRSIADQLRQDIKGDVFTEGFVVIEETGTENGESAG
ncbi:MAG: ABC transporter substrate-binding protein [Ruminococcus sp.]|nr:ABC transporter substrate-binding protein [Ruminococcus sp.]